MSKKSSKLAAPAKTSLPWGQRQADKVDRLAQASLQIATILAKACPPNVDHGASYDQLAAQLRALGDWRPSKTGKPTVGSTIKVKDDAYSAPTFQQIKPSVYHGAVIIGDDGTDWLVTCTDGVVRVLKKKYAAVA